jgi:hypothetical protein
VTHLPVVREAFDLNVIQRLRKQATDTWQAQLPGNIPEGWSVSSIDFSPMLAGFDPIGLRPGYALRAYQYREGDNGHSVVWAMRDNAHLPPPSLGSSEAPVRPAGALADPMEALEGDGSLRSYLYASVFARVAASVGAFGHGVYWDAFDIIDRAPEDRAAVWRWVESEPTDWRPSVVESGAEVSVTMYAFTGLGGERIVALTDIYPVEQYIFRPMERVLARGGPGYTW